jgi:putative DNA primase/helicase
MADDDDDLSGFDKYEAARLRRNGHGERRHTNGSGEHSDTEDARKEASTIRVVAGERHKAADAGIAALVSAQTAFYQRDRSLVRVCQIQARSSSGDIILVPGITEVTQAILERALGQTSIWQRFDAKVYDWVRTDPPRPVTSQILDMVGEWPFPALAGVLGCPTLRQDGSLLATEGYDFATGLVLISAVAMPRLSDAPTRSDADEALDLLSTLINEFPFANDVSRTVALSSLLTPVLRGAMPVAPLHLAIAPEAGSGKSYLADIASMIATGERAAVVATAPNPEETEKRLIGSALSGHPIISLDNCSETLEGDFLCQITERPLMQLRRLGTSDQVRITNTFTTFANGNNVAVAADMVRRTLTCGIDTNTETPECRTFLGDPIAAVRRNRGAYIAACLTIARAYIAAGKPDRLPPLNSFEGWSDTVRSPLVWLGCADPVESIATARRADPVRQERGHVFEAWRDELGTGIAWTVPEIIEKASARSELDGAYVRPSLAAQMSAIAQKQGVRDYLLEPRRLGKWLAKQENTVAGGLKLTVDRADLRRVRYRLDGVGK